MTHQPLVVLDKANRQFGELNTPKNVGLSIREDRDQGEDRSSVMIGPLGSTALPDNPKPIPANSFPSNTFTH